jgi:hypothetical protein
MSSDASRPSRVAAWYPDPWGTESWSGEHERWFDGSAWTQRTRLKGSAEAFGGEHPEGPVESEPISTQPIAGSSGPGPSLPGDPAAGWYADPWGGGGLRWWDGATWTGHVSTAQDGLAPAVRLEVERTAARWSRAGLLIAGPGQAVAAVAVAFQARWMADHWDEITRPGSSVLDSRSGDPTVNAIAQIANIAVITAAILFLVWIYRAAQVARDAGLPARRSPGLVVLSFVIPIVNLWWPYQSTCDLLPEGHPVRQHVRRWWALWLVTSLGGIGTFVAAFLGDVALAVVAGATGVAALLAAVAARLVVAEIVDAHSRLIAERV